MSPCSIIRPTSPACWPSMACWTNGSSEWRSTARGMEPTARFGEASSLWAASRRLRATRFAPRGRDAGGRRGGAVSGASGGGISRRSGGRGFYSDSRSVGSAVELSAAILRRDGDDRQTRALLSLDLGGAAVRRGRRALPDSRARRRSRGRPRFGWSIRPAMRRRNRPILSPISISARCWRPFWPIGPWAERAGNCRGVSCRLGRGDRGASAAGCARRSGIAIVALSGGVFQNELLLDDVLRQFASDPALRSRDQSGRSGQRRRHLPRPSGHCRAWFENRVFWAPTDRVGGAKCDLRRSWVLFLFVLRRACRAMSVNRLTCERARGLDRPRSQGGSQANRLTLHLRQLQTAKVRPRGGTRSGRIGNRPPARNSAVFRNPHCACAARYRRAFGDRPWRTAAGLCLVRSQLRG